MTTQGSRVARLDAFPFPDVRVYNAPCLQWSLQCALLQSVSVRLFYSLVFDPETLHWCRDKPEAEQHLTLGNTQ